MEDLSVREIVTSVDSEHVATAPCQICRLQCSKYTCPKCNVQYCSLTCFRSTSHNQCSEAFYREEVRSGIGNAPSSTAEERLQMMEALKRFEESSLEEDHDVDDDFSERMRSVDLDAASTEDLWKTLSSEQQKKFLHALQTPSSDLTQQLLASEELLRERKVPWWTDVNTDNTSDSRPTMMSIPSSMLRTAPVAGPSLMFNICAICIAYAYTNRTFGTSLLSKATDDEAEAMRQMLSQLVPFLTDRKSKILHSDVSSVVVDISSRIGARVTARLISILVRDASGLLRPGRVTELPQKMEEGDRLIPDSARSLNVLLVLSDIAALFERAGRWKHVYYKLNFYAAHVIWERASRLDAMADMVLQFLDAEER